MLLISLNFWFFKKWTYERAKGITISHQITYNLQGHGDIQDMQDMQGHIVEVT